MVQLTLVLAETHDSELAKKRGTESSEFAKEAAKAFLSPRDMKALGVNDGDVVTISLATAEVSVRAFADEGVPEGIVIMPPGPWSTALLPPIAGSLGMPPQGGIKVTVKRGGRLTRLDELLT